MCTNCWGSVDPPQRSKGCAYTDGGAPGVPTPLCIIKLKCLKQRSSYVLQQTLDVDVTVSGLATTR
eukprot:scaffold102046_cov19-Phaeocystis_antarctica.AAC.1